MLMTVGEICNLMHGLKPILLMVLVQVVFAGFNVLYKLAANDGMSLRVVVAYRHLFATAFLVPLALILERKSRKNGPKLTWVVLFQAFLCGLFGAALAQNAYAESMVLTSATFTAAILNLSSAMTFILGICVGLERLRVRTLTGKAKVLGTIMGVGGAMLLTLYKGAEINIWPTHVDLLHHGQLQANRSAPSPASHAFGSLLAFISCFSGSVWLIIQARMIERYPCIYSGAALMCAMAAIQSTVFALCLERDWSQWKLGWNIRLLTVAYSGILATGLMVGAITWCVRVRGPVFVSVFSPLLLVLVAIAGSVLLDEKLHLGSLIGAVFIVCGLYVFLWAKNKEMKKMSQLPPPVTPATNPLVGV